MQRHVRVSELAPGLVPSESAAPEIECQYFVIRNDAGWAVQCEGENSEPFASRQDAILGACGLAHLDDLVGRRSEVVVRGDDDVFRTAWTAGEDAYPPARDMVDAELPQRDLALSH